MDVGSNCLVPLDNSFRTFRGFVSVRSQEFEVGIYTPEGGAWQDSLVYCDEHLRRLLMGHEHTLKRRLLQTDGPRSFLNELTREVDRILSVHPTETLPTAEFYAILIAELDEVGLDKVVELSSDMTTMCLATRDAAGRMHHLTVRLSASYPDVAPRCSYDLPERFEVNWAPHSVRSLGAVLQQFERAVARYQPFWDELDNLDAHTWVVEPEKPTRSAQQRRIALAAGLFLEIVVSIHAPRGIPDCVFLGSPQRTERLRQKLGRFQEMWSLAVSVKANLEKILGMSFPSRVDMPVEEILIDCAICYSYRAEDGSLPEIECETPTCHKPFHRTCLLEWLQSLPDTGRQFRDIIHGSCAYCGGSISVTKEGT